MAKPNLLGDTKKKRVNGDNMGGYSTEKLGNTITALAPIATYAAGEVASSQPSLSAYQNYSKNSEVKKQAITSGLTGLSTGASLGAALGTSLNPGVGTAIGAAAGAIIGTGIGIFRGKRTEADRIEETTKLKELRRQELLDWQNTQATANEAYFEQSAQNNYYEKGGQLSQGFNEQLAPLSSTASEVQGPSHAQGGVMLGNNEVEGKETIDKNYVFSDKLGFAKIHKPIAKAIGRIEGKNKSPEGQKALERMNARVDKLKLAQEFIKTQIK